MDRDRIWEISRTGSKKQYKFRREKSANMCRLSGVFLSLPGFFGSERREREIGGKREEDREAGEGEKGGERTGEERTRVGGFGIEGDCESLWKFLRDM